ncbi:MAG: hypothetical protein JWL69_1778 [Phycisphaerales bacterium]|jgi:hypothetical protein|nr:hypothetical protein [Phycisphaerales bacterium]MDB5355973.1 hypothetical protein [Phycisphaerales bacterium]
MKAYLVTTGILFGVMALLHVWRAIAEWPHPTVSPLFVLGMTALVIVPGALSWWAWRLLIGVLSENRTRGDID